MDGKILALVRALRPVTLWLDRYGAPVVDLLIRLALFRLFFFSGLTKIGNWEGALQLFEYEYQLPILPPVLAAYLGTATELLASTALLIGLCSRLAALPLLILTMTIQFVLGAANPAYNAFEHYLWMVMLLNVVVRGPGLLSVDQWLVSRAVSTKP